MSRGSRGGGPTAGGNGQVLAICHQDLSAPHHSGTASTAGSPGRPAETVLRLEKRIGLEAIEKALSATTSALLSATPWRRATGGRNIRPDRREAREAREGSGAPEKQGAPQNLRRETLA